MLKKFVILNNRIYHIRNKELMYRHSCGYFINDNAYIESLNDIKDIEVLKNYGCKKIYANFGDDISTLNPEFIGYDGSGTNFSTTMYYAPMGLLFPDYQDKVDNDKITKMQYGPTINRTWEFENMRDNPEWLMQDTR